ncbi:MAG: arylesterase [Candidatus Latescibacteria bacterium]|nr:arylesterase [Candidatus Latescibacterota bacterium]
MLVLALLVLVLGLGELAAESSGPEEGQAPVVLFFGDSLTDSYGVEPEEAYPAVLQARVDSLGWAYKMVNAGLAGETSAAGMRRVNWVLKKRPDYFVLALGANDGLRGIPLESTRQNLQAIVDRVLAKYPEVEIVIAGMLMPPSLGPEYTAEFAALFPALARENDLPLIPFLLEEVGGVPRYNQADGIHPNAAGHRLVADNVWAVLGPLLDPEPDQAP